MRYTNYCITSLLACCLLPLTGCSTYEGEDPALVRQHGETVNLSINVFAPAGTVTTRAGEYGDDFTDNEVTATNPENAMHKVQIWAFVHGTDDDAQAIAYKDTTFTATTEGDVTTYVTEHTIQMPILKYYVQEKARLDFWVVCNPDAVGLTNLPANDSPTRATLKALMFGHEGTNDYFGTTRRTSRVPENGLPMSAVYTGTDNSGFELSTDGETIVDTKPSITLKRAISRVRFVFSRSTEAKDVQIDKIVINGPSLPAKQFLFPAESSQYVVAENVETSDNDLTLKNNFNETYPLFFGDNAAYQGATQIPACTNPETLKQGAVSGDDVAQSYYERIDAAVSGTTPTACEYKADGNNYIYLRESFYKLSGTIYYTIDGKQGTATFENQLPEDFSRNHTWIVYGYFNRGTLQLTVTVQPWEYIERVMDYTQTPLLAEDGYIKWTAGTYGTQSTIPEDPKQGGIIFLQQGITAQCTFELNSPKGFVWTALFNSLEGNPDAFRFVDADGNNPRTTAQGTVGLGPVTLYIQPTSATVNVGSEAILTIVVRLGEGKTTPIDELSTWHIVQSFNQ